MFSLEQLQALVDVRDAAVALGTAHAKGLDFMIRSIRVHRLAVAQSTALRAGVDFDSMNAICREAYARTRAAYEVDAPAASTLEGA